MLIILPFHRGDCQKAANLMELCSKLETVSDHQLILLYPHNTGVENVQLVHKFAQKAFTTVHHHAIPHDIPRGWPQGPNKMFVAAASLVKDKLPFESVYVPDYRVSPNGSFLWLEPDCIPTGPGWLNKLQLQYLMVKKPFLGTIRPTLKQDVLFNVPGDASSGIKEYLQKEVDGEHMVLVGMYDRQIYTHISWLTQAGEGHEAIDVVIQNEVCQRDATGQYTRVVNSTLIGHGWHTSNYRITKDTVEFITLEADTEEDNTGDNTFTFHRRGYEGPCLIHGCKDNSLIECVEYVNGLRDSAPVDEEHKAVNVTLPEGEVATRPGYTKLHDPPSEDDLLEKLFAKLLQDPPKLEGLLTKVAPKAKAADKPKKATAKQVDEEAVWEYYTQEVEANPGKAWQNTLKQFSIGAKTLSAIRKAKTS